ncbi:MFS transporter [Propionibacteriaceae bacterium G1746]
MTQPPSPSFTGVLRKLALPVYAPTLLQASALTAIAPVLPLIALDLGFSVAAAAALGLITGVLGVLGPVPAGRLITGLGERSAMIITGVVLVAVFAGGWWTVHDAATHGAGGAHRVGLVATLLGAGVGQQVWNLGRQSYVGSAVDPRLRARAMSTFGGMMRIGQVIGPVLGAGATAWFGDASVFALAGMLMAAATMTVTVFLVPVPRGGLPGGGRAPGAATAADKPARPSSRALLRDPRVRAMAKVALGAAPLQMARVSRPMVLPLVGAGLGVPAEVISLIFAAAALVEIALFIPAGTFMDRYGRTAVLVPCLLMLGLGYVGLAVLATGVGTRSPATGAVVLAVTAAWLALGNGLGAGIVMTLGLDLTPEQDRARHLAVWMTMTGVGPLAGPALVSGISLVAPVAVAGAAIGVLCLGGGLWMLRVLPALTPNPPRGPFHRAAPMHPAPGTTTD